MPESVPLPLKGKLENVRQLERQVQQVANKVSKNLKIDFTGSRKNVESLSQPLGRITGKADEFTKSMEAANARVIAFGASVGILSAVTKSFKALVTTTIEVEKSLAKINSILNTNVSGLNKIKGQIFDIARETEQTFDTVAEAALELSRQGLSATEVTKRLKDSLILARLSGVGAAEAVGSLTAAVNGFSKSGLTTSEILNKVSAAANKFAVSERDLFEGFKRSASVAQQAGVSLDELGGIITAVQQKTARGGAVIGNSFKTIFTRIGRAENLDLLQSVGVEITDLQGKILPATTLIENLAKQLKNLDDVQVRSVSEKIGGGFQIAPLLAALQDYSSENSVAVQATQAFANATDEAFQKNIILNKTLSASIQSTSLSVKELANTLGELGVTDVFGTLLNSVQNVVGNIKDLLQGDGIGSVFARGFVKGVSGLILPALGLVLVIVAKLSKDLVKFGVDSLKTFLGLNNAAERLKSVEERTFQVLLNNETVRKQILAIENSSVSTEQKRLLQSELFTKSLLGQKAVLQELQQISARVAPGIIAGVNPGKQRVSRSAGGFLPVGSERSDISRGVGGAPSSAKPVVIPNFAFGGGKKGTMVANSSEYIIPNFAGGGSAIFNQDMVKSMGLPSGAKKINAAGGYIPNFAAGVGPASFLSNRGITNIRQFRDIVKKQGGGVTSLKRDGEGKNISEAQAIAVFKRNPETLGTYNANKKPNSAVMLVPQEKRFGANFLNKTYTSKKEYIDIGGKRQRVKQFIGGAAGIDPSLRSKESEYASLLGLDKEITQQITDAANNTVAEFDGKVPFKLTPRKYTTSQFEKIFLKEGGAGASGAIKGAIFEGIINAITGGVESQSQNNTLDVDFNRGAEQRRILEDIFGLEGKGIDYADFKSSISDGNSDKYRTQLFKNLPKQLEKSTRVRSTLSKTQSSALARSKRSASGYIPNFAMSPLEDAIQREKQAGLPVSQIRINQDGGLRNSQNPQGLAVTNTRDEPTGAIPQNAAKGFVPNFVGTFMAASAAKAGENANSSGSPTTGAAADSSAKLFALSTAAFTLQGVFGSVGEEATGAAKTMSELAKGATQAVTTLLLLQGFGVKLGKGQGFLPTNTSSFGLGKGGKLRGLGTFFKGIGKFAKFIPGVTKGLGIFTKILPRLIPGVGQAVIAFQILSPLVKALFNRFKFLGDAVDGLKNSFLDFIGLIPGIDSREQRREKNAAKESSSKQSNTLASILGGKGSRNIFAEEAKKQRAIKNGTLGKNEEFDPIKVANAQIKKELDSFVGGIKGASSRLRSAERNTQLGLLGTLNKEQTASLIANPESALSLAQGQKNKLSLKDQKQLEQSTKKIAEYEKQANDPTFKNVRENILRLLDKEEKKLQDILGLILDSKKGLSDQEEIEIRKFSTLKAIDDLRRSAALSASKALVGAGSELEFQLKLQSSLKQTSDLTKSSSERRLRFIDQEKKKRIDLLDVFDKTVTQNEALQVTALPGGKRVKDSDIERRKNALASARFQVQETGTFDEDQLRKQIGDSGLVKGNLEDIISLAKESFKIKSAEINAKNAEINIQKENLKLIKLAVQEERNRETVAQRILDIKGEQLNRERTSAENDRDLAISKIKLKGGSIQSEAQAFAQEKAINNVNKDFTRKDFERQRGLASETLLKDVVTALKAQGVKVDRATQGSLRESLQGKGGSVDNFKKAADDLVTGLNAERKQEKIEAIQAKIEAKEALLLNIRLNQNISNVNKDAADIQLLASKNNLAAFKGDGAAELASLTLPQLQEALSKTQSDIFSRKTDLRKKRNDPNPFATKIPGLEDSIVKKIQDDQQLESLIKEFIAIRAKKDAVTNGGNQPLTKSLESDIVALGVKLADSKKGTDGGATGINDITGALGDFNARTNDLKTKEQIAFNEFDIAIRNASGGLTTFGNLLAKEVAGSEQRKQTALFQARTSTDPSQILSGLSTARRESTLQSTGSVTEANESQLLLEQKLSLIEATSTAQRIQAEEEYQTNLQILKIRQTINDQSSPEEQEAAIIKIQKLLSKPDTLKQGLVKALAVDGVEASANIKNTLIDGAVTFRDTLIDGIIDATQKGADLKDILLDAATQFLNQLAKAQLKNAFGSIFDAVGNITGSIGGAVKKASGGMINGGSGTKDDVPAMLMGGEYVIKKSAVQKYGPSFMDKVNGGQIEKFNTGGLVGDNFADIFGSPFRPNERNRFESSGAYGNPLKSGSLAIQTGEGGFLAPGVFGGGAIKGRDDLIAFAGQGFTSGLNDRRRFGSTKGGGFSGIDLEPESVRLTNFGRARNSPLQNATRDSKQQAFDAFVQENSERTRLKLEEKQRKKERKEAFKNAVIGAVVSTAIGAVAKSATAGFTNAFNSTRDPGSGAGNLFKSLGSGLKGIFTGGEIKGLDGNFGGLVNIFSEKGSLTATNLSSFFQKNPSGDIAQQYIENNPGSPITKQIKANRLLQRALGNTNLDDNSENSRQALSNVNEITTRATGGYVPSRAGIDNVPTMLSGGEFVLNSAATQRIGQGNLENINAGSQENQVENQEDLLDKVQELVDLTKEGGASDGNISITVNSSSSGSTTGQNEESDGSSSKKDQELARKIKDQVLQIINEEKRLGGTLRRI